MNGQSVHANIEEARRALKRVYGYDSFRTGQEQIIGGILDGSDTLAILPTGGGKSVCYQIPAILLPGTTLVVSPLISLMKDQVDTLRRLGVSAAYLNSSMGAAEYRDTMRSVMDGEYKLLYIAPERFDAPLFQTLSERLHIPLIAIDEAHCVSQWGHDFRPSYRQLADWIGRMASRPLVAAFTATATEEVAEDIARMLQLRQPRKFVTGFARPNLALSVVTGADKRRFLLQYVEERKEQTGIIYTATRKEAEEVCSLLAGRGIEAGVYHGGLPDAERAATQENFRYDRIRVMAATNAFGMGIDKPNVRYVLHWQLPGDLESYYQEAGRAGRDGEESECVLLFDPADMNVQRFLIQQGTGDEERKSIQLAKLHTMMNYCRTERCLQQFIVDYFGDRGSEPCGKCSSCQDTSAPQDRTEEARMALSCVGRMKGRFGVTMAAKVLKGSRDKRLLEFGLDRLSTYGLLRNSPEKEIADWLYWLTAEGYLKLSEGQYPTVSLTAKALPVLEGKEPVLQRRRTSVRKAVSQHAAVSSPLFDALKAWRRETAAAEGVPPFMVLFDAALREIAVTRPASMDELLDTKGIGGAKADKYGESILAIVASAGGDGMNDLPPSSMPERRGGHASRQSSGSPDIDEESDELPSHQISLQLFREGLDPAEIAERRGMSQVTVEGHIIRCAEEGLEVDWERIVPPAQEEAILSAVHRVGADKLRPIKDELPEDVSYFAIKGAICKHGF